MGRRERPVANAFAQFLAGLEVGHPLPRYLNRFSRHRITRVPRRTVIQTKTPEPSDFDPAIRGQSTVDGTQDLTNDKLDILLNKLREALSQS
jgi:hypothetical protein